MLSALTAPINKNIVSDIAVIKIIFLFMSNPHFKPNYIEIYIKVYLINS